jgi:hypothetical protein
MKGGKIMPTVVQAAEEKSEAKADVKPQTVDKKAIRAKLAMALMSSL